jgi:hypothetical protein
LLWAKPNSFSTGNYFFGHTTLPAYGNRIQLYTDDTSGWLDLGLGDSHSVATNIYDLDAGVWYNIVLTWNAGNYIVYVNGVYQASGTYTGLTSLNSFADIGNHGNSANRNEGLNGVIDEVAIWNRVLSQTEIINLYNSGSEISCGASSSSCSSGADDLGNGNGVVEIGELLTFISNWKAGSVSISELLTAISEWKNGC